MIPRIADPFAPADEARQPVDAEHLAEVVPLHGGPAEVVSAQAAGPGLLARAADAGRHALARALRVGGVEMYTAVLAEHLPSVRELAEQYKTVPGVPRDIGVLWWACRAYGLMVVLPVNAAVHTALWLAWYPTRLVESPPAVLPSLAELGALYWAPPARSRPVRVAYRVYGFGLVIPLNAALQPLLWIVRYPTRLAVTGLHVALTILLSLL
ncbi:hypothetical protein ACWEN6_14080 [Sphaerisporangium sp. NPDC004334]